jgi:type I restriction enzyme S subunit
MVDIAGHGTGKLNTDELQAFELSLPQSAEQQRVAACLSSLDEMLTAQSRRVDELTAHKQGLVQQLFPSEGNEQ